MEVIPPGSWPWSAEQPMARAVTVKCSRRFPLGTGLSFSPAPSRSFARRSGERGLCRTRCLRRPTAGITDSPPTISLVPMALGNRHRSSNTGAPAESFRRRFNSDSAFWRRSLNSVTRTPPSLPRAGSFHSGCLLICLSLPALASALPR